ncbi:MAG: lipoprotein, partial [Bacteroidales bacterium]
MKKILFFLAAVALVAACGSPAAA